MDKRPNAQIIGARRPVMSGAVASDPMFLTPSFNKLASNPGRTGLGPDAPTV